MFQTKVIDIESSDFEWYTSALMGPMLWERLPYKEFACPYIEVFLIDFIFHNSA